MNPCDLQPLGAYFDCELAADARAAVDLHLLACADCRAELAMMQQGSRLLQGYVYDDLTATELTDLHAAVDAAIDESAYQPIGRICAGVAVVAASLLLICSVWLTQMRDQPGGRRSGQEVHSLARAESWEQVAITLRPDPLPTNAADSIHLADASMTDWMLDGLTAKKTKQ